MFKLFNDRRPLIERLADLAVEAGEDAVFYNDKADETQVTIEHLEESVKDDRKKSIVSDKISKDINKILQN